jgi:hypothetical protein
MTLLIACLLIYGFNLSLWVFCPLAVFVWLLHLGYQFHQLQELKKEILEELGVDKLRKVEDAFRK